MAGRSKGDARAAAKPTPRVLILAATTAYQTGDLVAAAEELGVEPLLATDRCHVLADMWPEGAMPLDFGEPDGAARDIAERFRGESRRLAAVIPTDERTARVAACASRNLGLPHNPPGAAAAAGDKLRFRRAMSFAGLPHPPFSPLRAGDDPGPAAAAIGYPVVIKPLHLSASRGVMRADGPAELAARAHRLVRLLSDADVAGREPEAAARYLVERYVPGDEVAFEGLLRGGRLEELAIFDKPEPLEGPFFAETIYVTPSRRAPDETSAIRGAVSAACAAIGLREGPVHAEIRLSHAGPMVLELASRSIGGLCGRTLRYGAGISVEQAVLVHAVGRDPRALMREAAPAAGVMMLPVPEAGVLREVDGEAEAAAVPGVAEVTITARPGDRLLPLPEGNAYLGFIFATGSDPDAVSTSLRTARSALTPRVAAQL